MTSIFHLLAVDDDNLIIESLKLILPSHWKLTHVADPSKLQTKMMFHAAFVDMHLRPQSSMAEGPEIIARLKKDNPLIEIVAISGDLSVPLMESCLNNGAQKFLAKPLIVDEVLSTLEKIEALWMMRKLETQGSSQKTTWIGAGPASQNIKKQIAALKNESGPILIEGETGTGKEVAAKLLNQQENLRPMISVNIAGIPDNLFESEMFGHVRGAFTGADNLKVGLAEAANGGDLLLDEIEALALPLQVKLLRFLENGEVRKIGAKESMISKARVIVATNQNLEELCKQGKFREDLLFRLNGKKITLPPLRDRTEDIPELAEHFLKRERPRVNKSFSAEALLTLQKYSWPGNVRELKRVCEQAALTSPLPIIRPDDIEALLQKKSSYSAAQFDYSRGLATLCEEFEARLIRQALSEFKDIEMVGEKLKVSRSSLYKKIKDYGIET